MRCPLKTWARMLAAAILGATLIAPAAMAQAPGTEIVDSKGVLVGLVNGSNAALRQLPDGQWVLFDTKAEGLFAYQTLRDSYYTFALFYTTSNCTGTLYLYAGDVPTFGVVVNSQGGDVSSGRLYYPAKPFQTLPILSRYYPYNPKTPCVSYTANTMVGKAKSTELSFTLPFSVK
jgi:hypothetical protein